jgi:hypothetical protein
MTFTSLEAARQKVADAKDALHKPFTIDPRLIEKKVLDVSNKIVKLESKYLGKELSEKTRPHIDKLLQKGVDKIIGRADSWLSKKTGIPNIGQNLKDIFSKKDTRERVGAIGNLVGSVLSKYSKGGGPVGALVGFTIGSATKNLMLSFYDHRKEIAGAFTKGVKDVTKNIRMTINDVGKAPLLKKPVALIKGGLKVGVSMLKGQLKTVAKVGKAVVGAVKATVKDVAKQAVNMVKNTIKDTVKKAVLNPIKSIGKKIKKKLKFW